MQNTSLTNIYKEEILDIINTYRRLWIMCRMQLMVHKHPMLYNLNNMLYRMGEKICNLEGNISIDATIEVKLTVCHLVALGPELVNN